MKKLLLILAAGAMMFTGCKSEDNAPRNIAIEDAVFKAYLVANFDTDGDGKISSAEAAAVTEIDVNNLGIASLKGIEAFVNLKKLYCGNNRLASLDVSKNTALTELYCYQNQLTSMDIGKNTALTLFYCDQNELTSLNVSKNTALKYLYCSYNQLTSLDVSKNIALTELQCYTNQLTSLDVSKNIALTELHCTDNPNMTELFLATGQTIPTLRKDNQTVIKYK